MVIEVTVRKWGNSLGFVLPKKFVEEENIKPGQKIYIDLVKKTTYKNIFK